MRQVASLISHNYQLAGVPDRFRFVEFDEEHGYPLSMRQAAYGWFKQWLLGDGDGSPICEPILQLLPDPYPVEYRIPPTPSPDNIRAQSPTLTPVSGALPGFCFPPQHIKSSQAVINARLRSVAEGRSWALPAPANSTGLSDYQGKIKQRIGKLLGPFPEVASLQTRLFNQVWQDQMMAERITFQSEPGINIPGLLFMPEEWKQPVPFVIYAGEWGKFQGIQSGLLEKLIRAGYGVLAIDVRGVGETATSDFEAATDLLMMDRPLFGQRVLDVIRAVDFIWERCYIGPQIDKGRLVIIGEGVGGLWGLYAAALDGRVAAVVAWDTLYSYLALLEDNTRFPASVYLFDVLKNFDISDVIAACAPRPVYLRPIDGQCRICNKRKVKNLLKSAKAVFAMADAKAARFHVSTHRDERSILTWLNKVLEF